MPKHMQTGMQKVMQTGMQNDDFVMLRTDGRTNGRTTHLAKTPHVTERAREIDEIEITKIDVLRTRVVLARLQGEQERLAAALNETGILDFADRADWLFWRREPEAREAWFNRWRQLGLTQIEPRQERLHRPVSLATPRRKSESRRVLPPVISEVRQMQIAMAVLAKQEAA